jgi:hypothetical protein
LSTREHGSASNRREHDRQSGERRPAKELPTFVAHVLDRGGELGEIAVVGKIAIWERVVCHTYTCDPLPAETLGPLSLLPATI